MERVEASELDLGFSGCKPATVGNAARKILDEFETLPDSEKEEVVLELLRRAVGSGYAFPEDADLLHAADQIFLELERGENPR